MVRAQEKAVWGRIVVMTIKHITLQSLEHKLGAERALRSCIPIDFYMILSAAGYIKGQTPADYMNDLDRASLITDVISDGDWSRPALTRALRERYDADIVSWQLSAKSPQNYARMIEVGYIENKREIDFFKSVVEGHSVEELVRAGYPVIVTMEPGFGTTKNKNIHAVIIADWRDNEVTVIDPDARNLKTKFSPRRVLEYISPAGGGTIVLPRDQ